MAQLFLLPFLRLAVLFLAAGRLNWGWGWVLAAVYFLISLVTFLTVRDPALIAERESGGVGAVAWDRRLLRAYGLLYLVTLLVAGLDAGRFGGSPPFPLPVHLLGLLCLTGTSALSSWAMRVNTFFSAYVRIQRDRDQRVVSRGPYRFVRHPGYVAMLLWSLGTPLLLGSLWALLPTTGGLALVVLRASREDRLLHGELPGYPAYARRVPYRLLPGLW